ncbi:MAG: ABC transporter permease [Acidimicrobiales bacterium]
MGSSAILGWVGLGVMATFVMLGLLAPRIRPFRPVDLSSDNLEGPSWRHLLGTNQIGQDLASQMLEGTRSSLLVAAMAGGGTLILGASVGMIAGLRRGWLDALVMRVIDVFLATPRLPLLILVGIYAGRDIRVVALVIALIFWPGTARAVRSEVLSLRRRAHLKAAIGFGAGPVHIMRRHVVPEISLILLASLLSAMGRAIMLEAGLAFLGIGDPSRTSWGSIMRDARNSSGLYYSRAYLWWMVPPVLAVVLTLLALTFIGVSLERRVNPRLSRHAPSRALR